MNHVKLLELVAIEKHNEDTYLHIKLFYEQEIELFWIIDDVTAVHLDTIYERSGNHKYRISLNSTYDHLREQYKSSFTKTYRDNSEPIFFDCSVKYKNCLEAIQNCKDITDFIKLPFISIKLPALNESTISNNSMHHQAAYKNYNFVTFSWLLAISAILILLTTSSHHFVNNNSFDSTVVIAAQPIVNIATGNKDIKHITIPSAATLVEDDILSHLYTITADDAITYSVPEGYVALTFDDGPSKYTKEITDILKEHDVGGTFFFLGLNAKKYPDVVRYVFESGYAIGNHSMNHYDLTELAIEEQENELLHATEIIEDITHSDVGLFRAPYGSINEQVIDVIQKQHYKIVHWNRDPKDWKTQDADKIIRYVREYDSSGSIILLHESQAVIDALPNIINILQEQNLKIVSLQ